jgi:hypothetical protein
LLLFELALRDAEPAQAFLALLKGVPAAGAGLGHPRGRRVVFEQIRLRSGGGFVQRHRHPIALQHARSAVIIGPKYHFMARSTAPGA